MKVFVRRYDMMKRNKENKEKKETQKNRPSKYLVVMSVVLSVLCLSMLLYDTYGCMKRNLAIRCEQKEAYLNILIEYASTQEGQPDQSVEDGIIDFIEQKYPTSASDYCFVAVDGTLVFLRDRDLTAKLQERDMEAYFGFSDESERIDTAYDYTAVVERSGREWYVSRYDLNADGKVVTVGICVSKDYMMADGDFDLMLQHVILYMVLFSVAFIVSVIFLSHREKENMVMEQKLTEQLAENRRLIERLGEQIEAQSDMEFQRQTGFCTKKVVEQVLEQLTEEQKEKSCKVTIRMLTAEPHLIVRYSVLLERMKVSKSVCCLWEKDEFMVLILNTDEAGARNFAKQFLLQYQKMFQSDARDIQISIVRL